MKRSYLSLVLLLAMGLLGSLKAQTYTKMWDKLEALERKDLPRSVVAEAMKIYEKAKAEQQVPQMMKAYLTAMTYRAFLTPDSLENDRKGLEDWAAQTQQPADKAVLYSILGEMWINTDVKKGVDYLRKSLQERDVLLKLAADNYAPVAKTGEISRSYVEDNLYDLLARRAVQVFQGTKWIAIGKGNQTEQCPQEVKDFAAFQAYRWEPQSDYDLVAHSLEVYRQWLEGYRIDGRREAWVLTATEALEYLFQHFSATFTNDACQHELRAWITAYPSVKSLPEAYLLLSNLLSYQSKEVERLKVVREAIARFPSYKGINRLKNIEKEILNPVFTFDVRAAYPRQEVPMNIRYKNLTGVTLQLYKVNLPVTSAVLNNRTANFEKKHASLQREMHFALRPTTDYQMTDSVLTLQAPLAGVYYLKMIPDGKQGHSEGALLYVTALKSIHRPLPDGGLEMVVVDGMSGHPVPDAEVVTYIGRAGGYAQQQVYRANEEGTVRVDWLKDRQVMYNVRTLSDTSMPITHLWKPRFNDGGKSERTTTLQLFTDRSFYRPGQTVYVSGIAHEWQPNDETRVLANQTYTVTLQDAAHNEIGKIEVKTNAFGSFSGQFTLPTPCLTGRFLLQAEKAHAEFRVEEYKRPTFDVVFDPVTAAYRPGDSIRVTGMAKTFAGAPVANADVHYRVVRASAWRWGYGGTSATWEGEVRTDGEGKFQVPVRFDIAEDQLNRDYWFYDFRVTADVTSGAGEMQQGSLVLPLGATSVVLEAETGTDNGYLIKEQPASLKWVARNLTGEPVDVAVTCRVLRLETDRDGQSTEAACVLTDTARSNKPLAFEQLYKLPSGRYRLQLSARDAQGRLCTARQDVTLFSLNDRRSPVPVTDWVYQTRSEFSDSVPAAIYLGSCAKDVYLMYDVYAGNQRVEQRRMYFSDSLLVFRFPYREAYGDGIRVNLAFVKEGKCYTHSLSIAKPTPQKQLQLKWTTFRDKLRPGQQEEWRLRVTYPDGRPADAELLATMYDASLDALYRSHRLPFQLDFNRRIPYVAMNESVLPSAYGQIYFPLKALNVPAWEYSRLDLRLPAHTYLNGGVRVVTGGIPRQMALARGVKMKQDLHVEEVVFEEEASFMADNAHAPAAFETTLEEESVEVLAGTGTTQIRQNFAETAFFYPQLRTDAQGEVSIAFTLPESLTRWKFLALAHTREVDHGTLQAEATASKEFMLQPNLPRFVRVGDKAHIATALVNLSYRSVKGVVRMELFNPETEKVLYTQRQKFTVAAGETGHVDFAFDVTDRCEVLACRLVADGDTFSDGEQSYLPVLTHRQWVTETMPFNFTEAGTHTLSLETLFNQRSRTASAQRLTVELTGQPAWYAVQALPAVADPQNEDALSWATAYYAHALATHIVQAYPRIQEVFRRWLAQGGTQETFLSHLQKNQELKNILLAETPWLTEATSETEQKQRVATLFQLNTLTGRQAIAMAKLRELQTADGAWSWYPGMEGSRYITTQVTLLLARLRALTSTGTDVQALYENALRFLDRKAKEEYTRMREAEQRGVHDMQPSEEALRYLYIYALDQRPAADEAVNRYFMDKLAARNASLTIYGKAMGAIILHRNGRTDKAQEFFRSLLEYSVATPEMGRYFDTPKALYSWFSYKIPTEVAAMEAIRLLSNDAKMLNEMKHWLLKQKQTQAWENPLATADAIYALLATDSDEWLAPASPIQVTLGKETLRPSADDALGYVRKTLYGSEATAVRKLTVNKPSDGLSWGAVYAQYLEDADRVVAQGNALSIVRTLHRGDQLLDEAAPLAVGDRLTVRLTVKADRDLDFVQLKDERAACLEPQGSVSGYRWNGTLGYYQAIGDASMRFFVDRMPKGTYVIEYPVYVTRLGVYRAGIASVQSAYAPEFAGHTSGYKVVVK